MSTASKPDLNTMDIKDPVIRRNFQNLLDYFQNQNQLQDFQFLEVNLTEATANKKFNHSLKIIPKDVFVTRVTGVGSVTFNFSLFSETQLDISSTGACRVRFFYGTKLAQVSDANVLTPESQTYNPGG